MKKHIFNILKILIFIFVFISFYYFLTVFKRPSGWNQNNTTGLYAERKNSLDMVYLGGSAAFVYFDPIHSWQRSGISSYVYGIEGVQAEFYTNMVKEVLENQKPKLIVIDARPFEYRNWDLAKYEQPYRWYLSHLRPSLGRVNFINKLVPKYLKKSTKSYQFDLEFYHTNEEQGSIKKTIKIMFDKNKHKTKGFYFHPLVNKLYREERNTNELINIHPEAEKILRDLLAYLKEKNVKALFVVCPYQQIVKEKAEYNYIEKIVKEYNQDFLDANDYIDQMNIDFNYDFMNESHLNVYGAEKYNDFLTDYLVKNYNLPDRRGEKEYKDDFDSLIPGWKEDVEKTKKEIDVMTKRKSYEEDIHRRS